MEGIIRTGRLRGNTLIDPVSNLQCILATPACQTGHAEPACQMGTYNRHAARRTEEQKLFLRIILIITCGAAALVSSTRNIAKRPFCSFLNRDVVLTYLHVTFVMIGPIHVKSWDRSMRKRKPSGKKYQFFSASCVRCLVQRAY